MALIERPITVTLPLLSQEPLCVFENSSNRGIVAVSRIAAWRLEQSRVPETTQRAIRFDRRRFAKEAALAFCLQPFASRIIR